MRDWNNSELLSAYANRQSEDAFGVLVERHIALVYSAALRQVQNTQLAEEVTQATFTILAQKARQLSGRTVLSGWLCCTAHFVARNALKTELRRKYREQEAHMQSLINEPAPEIWPQLAPLLDEAVAQLNEIDRNAVVLRFYEKKPLNEVGNILGVAPDAAQKRVSRALEKLRKFFARRGVNSTTAAIAGSISAQSIQAVPVALAKAVTVVALAKGATASASTLTLIKGALKIMAWTKAKTATVATVAVMLTAGTTTLMVETVHLSHVGVYQPIRDNEPDITARMWSLKMEELSAEDCTPEFWQQMHQSPLFNNPAVVKGLAAALGPLQAVKLVERTDVHGRRNYLYRMKYQKMNVLFLIVFDGEKIAFAKGYPESK